MKGDGQKGGIAETEADGAGRERSRVVDVVDVVVVAAGVVVVVFMVVVAAAVLVLVVVEQVVMVVLEASAAAAAVVVVVMGVTVLAMVLRAVVEWMYWCEPR